MDHSDVDAALYAKEHPLHSTGSRIDGSTTCNQTDRARALERACWFARLALGDCANAPEPGPAPAPPVPRDVLP